MRVIAQLLHLAGPLKSGFHLKIENPPWQDLVIEDIQQRGPNGFLTISVAHYGKQNGDLMRDRKCFLKPRSPAKNSSLNRITSATTMQASSSILSGVRESR